MRTNAYGEDDRDIVRRFAIREDGTARYPIGGNGITDITDSTTAGRQEAGNVIDLGAWRRRRLSSL